MAGRRTTEFVLDPGRVGRAIRARRTDAGQTRTAVPVAKETLRSIELGDSLPSLDTAARLADHFGCSIDDLVGRRATTTTHAPRAHAGTTPTPLLGGAGGAGVVDRDGGPDAPGPLVNTTRPVSGAGAARG